MSIFDLRYLRHFTPPLHPLDSFLRQARRPVKGGRFLPGVSEPLTGRWARRIDGREGEAAAGSDGRKLRRCSVVECAVRSCSVEISSPPLKLSLRIGDIKEHLSVQKIVP